MIFIAVPYFNRADYLKETLMSVQAQTDSRYKVRVLDDSIDPVESKLAQKVCDELQVPYSKNQENLGLAKNWNQAIEIAKKEGFQYLLILHADDRLKPEFVGDVLATFDSDPSIESVFTKVEIIGADGESKFSFADCVKEWIRPNGSRIDLKGVAGLKTLLSGDYIFCPTICYRVSLLGDRRFDSTLKQVLDFKWIVESLLIGELTGTKWVGLYERTLYQYRRHDQSLTGQQSLNFLRYHEEIEFYRWLSGELAARNHNSAAWVAKLMWMVRANLILDGVKSFLNGNFLRAWKLIQLAFLA